MPYHGKLGVVTPGKGKPRNHLVLIDGVEVIVPAGNLRPVPEEAEKVKDMLREIAERLHSPPAAKLRIAQ